MKDQKPRVFDQQTPIWKKVFLAIILISALVATLVAALYVPEREHCLRECGVSAECQYSEEFQDYVCVCKDGYEGNHINGCRDINECETKTHDCSLHAECVNSPGFWKCRCLRGFFGAGSQDNPCYDLNECDAATHDCGGLTQCKNRIGGFGCKCPAGFLMKGVDECVDNNECRDSKWNKCDANADCLNYDGKYLCRCKEGYEGNGFECDNICAKNQTCGSNAECRRTVMSTDQFTCECLQGFVGNGYNCVDVDDCELNKSPCSENSACLNTNGSFECTCLPGFERVDEVCIDLDECLEEPCGLNAVCNNTIGSFSCTCQDQYFGDGVHCTKAENCRQTLDCYGNNTQCVRENDEFECGCYNGYKFLKKKGICVDVDECPNEGLECNSFAFAKCVNYDGGFDCKCKNGYTGDGSLTVQFVVKLAITGEPVTGDYKNCTQTDCDPGYYWDKGCLDVDECKNETICSEEKNNKCKNFDGSFACTCKKGYSGEIDNCTDIDECLEMTDNCHANAHCENNPGSFSCTCKFGYIGDGAYSCLQLPVFLFLNEEKAELFDSSGRSNDVDFTYGDETSVTKSCSITWHNEFFVFGGDKSWLYQRQISKVEGRVTILQT